MLISSRVMTQNGLKMILLMIMTIYYQNRKQMLGYNLKETQNELKVIFLIMTLYYQIQVLFGGYGVVKMTRQDNPDMSTLHHLR